MANPVYKISATLGGQYTPLIKRTRDCQVHMSKLELDALRASGASNIDLWVDGSLYPHNPLDLERRPRFKSVSELLEFTGEGKKGLLGYIESLCKVDKTIEFNLAETKKEVQFLREHIQTLLPAVQERDQLLCSEQVRDNSRLELENYEGLIACEQLRTSISHLQNVYSTVKENYEASLQKIGSQCEDTLQMQIDHWIDVETMKEEHEVILQSSNSELRRIKATLRRRDRRIERMVSTPYGYRPHNRSRRDASTLVQSGGHAKRTLCLARSILNASTARNAQCQNAATGSKQRLCGTKEVQKQNAIFLSSLVSTTEASELCESGKFSAIGVKIANQYFDRIGREIGANEILETCDRNGITHAGYSAIYKRFKGFAKIAGKGLRLGCLPNPYSVSKVRQMLNLKLSQYVGNYYFINNTLEVPSSTGKSKMKEPLHVKLHDKNCIFVDHGGVVWLHS